MHLVHLTSSRFFGGPERQMLGLAKALPADCETTLRLILRRRPVRRFSRSCATGRFRDSAIAARYAAPLRRSQGSRRALRMNAARTCCSVTGIRRILSVGRRRRLGRRSRGRRFARLDRRNAQGPLVRPHRSAVSTPHGSRRLRLGRPSRESSSRRRAGIEDSSRTQCRPARCIPQCPIRRCDSHLGSARRNPDGSSC